MCEKRLGKAAVLIFNAQVMNKLADILIFVGLLAVATCFHLLGHVLAARLAGLKIEKVNLFLVTIFKFQTPFFPVEIGILPTGGSVKFAEGFQNLALPFKWLITLSGPFLVAISALIGLSFAALLPAFVSGFEQAIGGAISPVAYGAPLIQKFYREYVATSLFAAYGLLAIKLTAYNLLPIPGLNGGQLLTSLFPNFHESKWGLRIAGISLIIILALMLSWGVAFAVYLFR